MHSILAPLALTLMFASSANAVETRTVNFLCEAPEQDSLNRFTGSGLIEIKDGKGEGAFSGSVLMAGKNAEPKEIGEIQAKGSAQIIPPGKFAKNEVIVLQLSAEREAKPVRMIFNLGITGPVSSTFLIDGIGYKAKCSEYK